jgi:4-hydroxybenzoate polyprenyltransferase
VPRPRGPVSRRTAILLVLAVGAVFLVGLVVHGPVGGVLLMLVAATLALFSAGEWHRVRREGKAPRILIIVAVTALAVLKLAGTL